MLLEIKEAVLHQLLKTLDCCFVAFRYIRAAERNAELLIFGDAKLTEGEKFDSLEIVVAARKGDHGADFLLGIGETGNNDMAHPQRNFRGLREG